MSHLNDLKSLSMTRVGHENSELEVIDEDDADFFNDFVRHKVVYNG